VFPFVGYERFVVLAWHLTTYTNRHDYDHTNTDHQRHRYRNYLHCWSSTTPGSRTVHELRPLTVLFAVIAVTSCINLKVFRLWICANRIAVKRRRSTVGGNACGGVLMRPVRAVFAGPAAASADLAGGKPGPGSGRLRPGPGRVRPVEAADSQAVWGARSQPCGVGGTA
jgi:hypothetical protein